MGFTLDPRHVEGNLFKPSGKWMYTVVLCYSDEGWNDWGIWKQTRIALRRATDREMSGVIFREVPKDWMLVVLNPYVKNSHPIIVRGGE